MSETDSRTAEAKRYPRIVQFVRETPWAILEPKLLEIEEMVSLHVAGAQLSEAEVQSRIGSGPARRDSYSSGSVSVIPVHGVITPRADLMTEMSGGTSIDRLQQTLRSAVADPKVSAIVLDVNSPGGSTAMLNEMAAEIRQARKVKPVVAVANTMAASAAYHLASQANELVVTPSGSVGAIGTILTHSDVSAAQDKLGVKTTVITSSKHKGELSPFAPLSEDAKAHLQGIVDTFGQMFEQDVARGRGVPVGTVRSDFGQGRMLMAKDALKAGMVDRIDTLDNVVAGLRSAGADRGNVSATVADVRNEISSRLAEVDAALEQPVTEEAVRQAHADPPDDQPIDTTPPAALSGLSFAQEAGDLVEVAESLLDRTRSLAEFRDRGSLTASKREHLTACSAALREATEAIDQIVAATTPVNTKAILLAEKAKAERSLFREGAVR